MPPHQSLCFFCCSPSVCSQSSNQKVVPYHFSVQNPPVTSHLAPAKSLQSCPTLCDLMDGSPPGSPVPGILQARTLEWVAIFLLQCMKVKRESEVAQLCLIPCDPMDCSLPGSSIHGFFQGRVLEWGAIAFSRENIIRSHQVPQILLKSPVSSLAKST